VEQRGRVITHAPASVSLHEGEEPQQLATLGYAAVGDRRARLLGAKPFPPGSKLAARPREAAGKGRTGGCRLPEDGTRGLQIELEMARCEGADK